jgi:hypothetical protein
VANPQDPRFSKHVFVVAPGLTVKKRLAVLELSDPGNYYFDGVVRKYRPDFLIRLRTGTMLVLEVKGQDSAQNQAKRAALDEWARAVTQHGGFGRWTWAVSRAPSDLADLVHATYSGQLS